MLGANDGIVSTAGLVIGVAAATTERAAILTAGLAGLAAGAMSMAAGEYVSVSTQRDTEQALLAKEQHELREMPEEELAELADLYEARGLSPDLAHQVALQLTQHDALAAHAEVELGSTPRSSPTLARGLGVDGRVHRGRPAAPRGDPPVSAGWPGRRLRPLRSSWLWP